MIYFLIFIGVLLIVFSYFLEKKSKVLFKEIYEEEKTKPPIRLVNNTYEEIAYHQELSEMKEHIASLQKQNEEIALNQKSISKHIDYIDEPSSELVDELLKDMDHQLNDDAIDTKTKKESFLDELANEAGVRKGDLLSLKKS